MDSSSEINQISQKMKKIVTEIKKNKIIILFRGRIMN